MTTKKKMLLAVTSAVLLSGGLMASSAFAQDSTESKGLVGSIASKFKLKPADVQAVFDQHKQEMEATRQQKITDKLTQAVTDGKLTSAQKDLIIAKLKEVQQKEMTIHALTTESERRTAQTTLTTDLKTWATQNGIDVKWVLPGASRAAGRMHSR